MKKHTITFVFALVAFLAQAQIITEDAVSGNVGISETEPVQKLDVNGTTKTNQLIIGDRETIPFYANAWIEGSFASHLFFNSSLSFENERLWSISALNGTFKVFSQNDSFTDVREAFVINRYGLDIDNVLFPNGRVGIGLSSFQEDDNEYLLSVNGQVRAHGIKVYTSWADYVFKDNYELRPLNEVENFIEEHGHLPNVPSEAEVEKNGIELGKMNAKLLEKIEELTLYLIEQDKEIKTLKKQLNTLTNN